ncbi:hypothetical protein O0S10_00045 [Methanocorpusculum sp. MG]|uniref:Uncharacterized protein n=1 Tax=Methanocorpusculum petauri TaxID=3002863 RepID=A0ABT4ICZ4_9EURY|nr:hypothetical protein [Methanocorpusculum petauri]MCZ0859614.1 hypothetical protein [Methanocorpusculum petauri]MDE2443297.1 hypothetical protein [Methanocorpusculum sp.]
MKRMLIVLMLCVALLAISAGCVGTPAPAGGDAGPSGPALGAVPVSSEDGVTVYKNPDGSYYAEDEDGTKVQINPDGSWSGTSEDGSGSMDKDGNFNYQGTDGSSMVGSATGGHVEGDGGSLTYTIDENGVVHYKMVEPDGKVTEWTSDGSITQ